MIYGQIFLETNETNQSMVNFRAPLQYASSFILLVNCSP